MFEVLRKLAENIISLFQKLKCQFSCCNTEISVRILEPKTPRSNSS